MERGGIVYIMTNHTHTVLYVGVTSKIENRIIEHQEKLYAQSFTARYNVSKLVYYQTFPSIEEAIAEEKRIKAGSRAKKIKLINTMNPGWEDLSEELT
jgi:putative endonuclease